MKISKTNLLSAVTCVEQLICKYVEGFFYGDPVVEELNNMFAGSEPPKFRGSPMAVDLKVSLIRHHLAEGPSFGGQTAGAGGTPRHSYLPSI